MDEPSDIWRRDSDPGRWGHSIANVGELVTGCLDAIQARSVAEIGAYAGDLTGLLADWARGAKQIIAVDPAPQQSLLDLASKHRQLEVRAETSHEALSQMELPDALIIDGDHNYYTVSGDLELIAERTASNADLPLLMLHDVGWPHGRRDAYYDPSRIPDDQRQDLAAMPMVLPGEPDPVSAGLLLLTSARREGGPRNGVLTAVEDFLADRPELRFAIVPAFFGVGVIWHPERAGAEALAELLAAWDRNPVLQRLEANRVHHLATSNGREVELGKLRHRLAEERGKVTRQRRAIAALLDSSGLRIVDRISTLRHPRRTWSWAGRLRAATDEDLASRELGPGGPPSLTWLDEGRCRVGDTMFRISALPLEDRGREGTQLRVAKPRSMIDGYVELLHDLRPRNIFELGIFTGGSTALFFELARPHRLVAVDLSEVGPSSRSARLYDWISRNGYADRVRVYGGVDQGDRGRLAEVVAEEFGDEPLDLVVDDCSHLYEPTRASFNELFPRLRPGGVFVVEDWNWAHTELGREPLEGFWPDETPLTRLLFELVLAEPAIPGLIDEITIEVGRAKIVRGEAHVEPRDFDVAECSNPRGRSLLAADPSG